MRSAVVLALALAACARGPRVVETPAPVAPPPEPVLAEPVVAVQTVDTMVSYRVPPPREGPLITWGDPPPGAPRAERERTYDLQHQVTRVRFDWARRAVM